MAMALTQTVVAVYDGCRFDGTVLRQQLIRHKTIRVLGKAYTVGIQARRESDNFVKTLDTRPTRHTVGRVDSSPVLVPKGPTLAEAVADFLGWHRNKGSAPATLVEYTYYLENRIPRKAKWLPLLAWASANGVRSLAQLDKDACNGWLTQMRSPGTTSLGRKAVVMLKRFLSWCRDEDLLTSLPLRLTEPKRKEAEVAVFSDDEMRRIAQVVQKENVRDYAIFMLLLDTGLRSKELLNLTMDDVRLDKKELVVRSEVAKSGRSRVIPLTWSPGPLKAWLRERGTVDGCEWFFLSFAGSPVYQGGVGAYKRRQTEKSLRKYISRAPLTHIGLYQLVQKWGRLANVTEARNSPHTYRHFFAVTYLREGGDVFTLQKILGHSKLDMTLVYSKMAQIDVKKGLSKSSPAGRFLPARQQRIED